MLASPHALMAATFRTRAEHLRDCCYPLAAEIMAADPANPATPTTVRSLEAAAREIGEAARHLTEAAEILERLAHGPE